MVLELLLIKVDILKLVNFDVIINFDVHYSTDRTMNPKLLLFYLNQMPMSLNRVSEQQLCHLFLQGELSLSKLASGLRF